MLGEIRGIVAHWARCSNHDVGAHNPRALIVGDGLRQTLTGWDPVAEDVLNYRDLDGDASLTELER
jgi:hypothetical protein